MWKNLGFAIAMLLTVASPGVTFAIGPPVANEGSMFISEVCEGKTTAAALDWRFQYSPGQRANYVITYIDVTDGHSSLLSIAQREMILRDINRWTEFSLLSISNLRPFCSDYKSRHAVLMDVRYELLHSNGPLFDRLSLEIDLDAPEKTGLYTSRLIDGKVQQVSAAIAEIPPWKDPPAKK